MARLVMDAGGEVLGAVPGAVSSTVSLERAYELAPVHTAELMRTRYCIRHELGICPVHHHRKNLRPLFLLNNGRRFALHFDCSKCEMTVTLP